MAEIEVPGWGVVDLNLATCSVRGYHPELGFAVRTSVGSLRGFKHPHANVSELAPYGIFKNPKYEGASWDEKRAGYYERLNNKGVSMFTKLVELQREHPDQALVLLCWENVHQGEECHRRWAADWFKEQLGLDVPEVSDPNEPPRKPRGPSTGPSIHETRARQAKAETIAGTAMQLGLDGMMLRALSEHDWKQLAKMAGARPPSPTTQALVVELVEQRAVIRAALPTDPFEGLAATA